MSSGLPVVASRSGGITDIITEGENGLLAAERDEKQLADRINLLLSDDALYKKLSAASRKTAEGFDYSVIASRYAKIIESCR